MSKATTTKEPAMTAILTARQTMMRDLLVRIHNANQRGENPTKLDVIGDVPNKTRAGHYKKIDELIRLGLVENTATSGNAYALRATETGRVEIAA